MEVRIFDNFCSVSVTSVPVFIHGSLRSLMWGQREIILCRICSLWSMILPVMVTISILPTEILMICVSHTWGHGYLRFHTELPEVVRMVQEAAALTTHFEVLCRQHLRNTHTCRVHGKRPHQT